MNVDGENDFELEEFDVVNHSVQLIDVDKISVDGDNPNVMSESKREALVNNLKVNGNLGPIVLNKDYLIADGEHRWLIYKELGIKQIPAYVLDINEGQRLLLRQTGNMSYGVHDEVLQAKEILKIIDLGDREQVKLLLDYEDNDIKEILRALKTEKAVKI